MQGQACQIILIVALWTIVGASMFLFKDQAVQIVSQVVTGIFALLNLGKVVKEIVTPEKEKTDGNLPQ
jgi:predicted Na+-dependent transporter